MTWAVDDAPRSQEVLADIQQVRRWRDAARCDRGHPGGRRTRRLRETLLCVACRRHCAARRRCCWPPTPTARGKPSRGTCWRCFAHGAWICRRSTCSASPSPRCGAAARRSVTPEAVQEALGRPRELSEELIEAYLARRALDFLVGFKLSPLLWRKVARGASAGRVQSVALRMVRESPSASSRRAAAGGDGVAEVAARLGPSAGARGLGAGGRHFQGGPDARTGREAGEVQHPRRDHGAGVCGAAGAQRAVLPEPQDKARAAHAGGALRDVHDAAGGVNEAGAER
eukprot:scaffold2334_cov357-Prasinococcus_capsulatus_cf.AAC.8